MTTTRVRSASRLWFRMSAAARAAFVAWSRWRSALAPILPFCAARRMVQALRLHWPEYLMEAAALGVFMVSACVFGALLWHPDSPARGLLADGIGRRAVMGLAMGLTAIGIIYSPWGQQSGAHMNPAVTLTFWRLGKVARPDAVFYVLAQFAGGLAGVLLARLVLGSALAHPAVHYVVTRPGPWGVGAAFVAEACIT